MDTPKGKGTGPGETAPDAGAGNPGPNVAATATTSTPAAKEPEKKDTPLISAEGDTVYFTASHAAAILAHPKNGNAWRKPRQGEKVAPPPAAE